MSNTENKAVEQLEELNRILDNQVSYGRDLTIIRLTNFFVAAALPVNKGEGAADAQLRSLGKTNAQRDLLAEKEGSPYHETQEARVMAFKNGWNAHAEYESTAPPSAQEGEIWSQVATIVTYSRDYETAMSKLKQSFIIKRRNPNTTNK